MTATEKVKVVLTLAVLVPTGVSMFPYTTREETQIVSVADCHFATDGSLTVGDGRKARTYCLRELVGINYIAGV